VSAGLGDGSEDARGGSAFLGGGGFFILDDALERGERSGAGP